MKILNLFSFLTLTGLLPATLVLGQYDPSSQPFEQAEVEIELVSGDAINLGTGYDAVFSESIQLPGAKWLRLKFDEAILGEAAPGKPETIVRITSLYDGATQILNKETMLQWGRTTAYFNGDAVLVEVIADASAETSVLTASQAWVGYGASTTLGITTAICGDTDDRILATDPRIARVLTSRRGVCTAWILNDNQKCMVSAAHCDFIGKEVVQFNVPLANEFGGQQHPGPEDQYVVDPISLQFTEIGFDNDWAYFAVYPNAVTGMTPYEAQGNVAFDIAAPPNPPGATVRMTGYGITGAAIDPTWNFAQKTNTGPFVEMDAMHTYLVHYDLDTTGGDSGAPVFLEGTEEVIAIHTLGFCTNVGGTNAGTAMNHPDFLDALANPRGLCLPEPPFAFSYPEGLPEFISPLYHKLPVQITTNAGHTMVPGSATLHYSLDQGETFTDIPMSDRGNDLYYAEFPYLKCDQDVFFYVSAETDTGIVAFDRREGPANGFLSHVGESRAGWNLRYDFEAQAGWTSHMTGDTTTGEFERGVPIGGGFSNDPRFDGDGSGQCFLTENLVGNSDVDGSIGEGNVILPGQVWIKSPEITIPMLANPDNHLWFRRWFGWSQSSFDPSTDTLAVYIRETGSQTATLVDEVMPTDPDANAGWRQVKVNLNGIVAQGTPFKIEFYAFENDNPSVFEVGIDDVRLSEGANWAVCNDCPTDVNDASPGVTDDMDAGTVRENWKTANPDADIDQSGEVDVMDLIYIYRSFGDCPDFPGAMEE